jgi:trehalose 6-phosphate synthase
VGALIVVANRGPSVSLAPDGTPIVAPSAGGVAPSLQRALQLAGGGQWICAAQRPDEHALAAKRTPVSVKGVDVAFVSVPDLVLHAAVGVIANQTLWFVNHNLYDAARRPLFDRHWHAAWDAYRTYNEAFVDRIVADAPDGATVVVNDYHLALVGAGLARRRPDLATVCFFHTPFAAPEELAILPRAVRVELLSSLGAFGAVGFHVERWADAFRRCAKEIDIEPSIVLAPLGVDAEALAEFARAPEVLERRAQLEARLDGRQLIARSDRVELSKNLIRGFLAFAELLEAEPNRRGRVTFAARTYASRTDLPEYLAYANDLQRIVDRINARFAVGDHLPIELDVADDLAGSFALLCSNDALLVNPVRDGMNLVAKEGSLLNDRNGTLLLSEQAGAFDELAGHCLAVEPFDVSGTARVIARALDMDDGERAGRAAGLRAVAPGLDPYAWLERVSTAARVPPTRAGGPGS